jgi:hypothetical protein
MPSTTSEWKRDGGAEARKVFGPETITVPAGAFEAIRVEWWITLATAPEPVAVRTEWYALGVGLVKSREHLTGETDAALGSFTPGKH